MNHQDHVNLLRRAIPERGGRWADFGSGDGAFTLALRDLIGEESEIFSIEKDKSRLDQQQRNFRNRFRNSNIHFIHADFILASRHDGDFGKYPVGAVTTCDTLDLPPLDGIVIANALHFFHDKEHVLRLLRGYITNAGRLVLVEYNVDSGNPWVPYPISFDSFVPLAQRAGFVEPRLVATVPSRFLREIYSAVAIKK